MYLQPFSLLLSATVLLPTCHAIRSVPNHIHQSKLEPVMQTYFRHSEGQRVNTDALLFDQLREIYPDTTITTVPVYDADLMEFAAGSEEATAERIDLAGPKSEATHRENFIWHTHTRYAAPQFRMTGSNGTLYTEIMYATYIYGYKDVSFLVYVVKGNDGTYPAYPEYQYIISNDVSEVNDLIMQAGLYRNTLHNEIWVFDQGYWAKDTGLWSDVQKANWDNVILDEKMKSAIKTDVLKFFDAEKSYRELNVPWKRGIIFHGPPGNGKTISIKATMKSLYSRPKTIPAIFIKSLASFGGPEYALKQIFSKARAEAPCLMIFEDLDSLVTPAVRSYFLNQVDGLQANDGILMIGSTNHMELLDPGISKRPSRFDRKYLFPNPDRRERVLYCEFWKSKISRSGQSKIEFPHVISEAVANITDGFSFAYIQEAFVAALLEIARDETETDETYVRAGSGQEQIDRKPQKPAEVDEDDLDKYILWRVIKQQVALLRHELESEAAVDEERFAFRSPPIYDMGISYDVGGDGQDDLADRRPRPDRQLPKHRD